MPDSTPSLDALAAAGVPIDSIDEQKRAVLASLSDEETAVLVGIIDKMTDEVEGFGMQFGRAPAGLNPSLNPSIKPGIEVAGLPNAGMKLPPGALDDKGGVFW